MQINIGVDFYIVANISYIRRKDADICLYGRPKTVKYVYMEVISQSTAQCRSATDTDQKSEIC